MLEIEILSLVECSVFSGDSLKLRSTDLPLYTLLHFHRRVQKHPKNHGTVEEDVKKGIAAVDNTPLLFLRIY